MKSIASIVLVLITGVAASAQGFYNNGATVSVSAQTIFVLPDSLVNKGTLTNNGDMRVAGAWINTGVYSNGTGSINFNSDLPQIINHNDQSVERLSITGGGEKKFQANITVRSALILTNGILTSENGARLIIAKGGVVTGGSNTSHIKGPVERVGAGNWLFPVGNGSLYLPVLIGGVTDDAAAGVITMHELTQGETLSFTDELGKLSAKRYYNFAFIGSSVKPTEVRLPFSSDDQIGAESMNMVVAGSNDPFGPYASLGRSGIAVSDITSGDLLIGGNVSSGFLVSNKPPSFSYLAVAALNGERGIKVYNAVSTGNDGKNDFMTIENISLYPDNKVSIVNRWGDRVFQASGYDNNQVAFRGYSDNGNKLPAGTYYYTINLGDGSPAHTGYVAVK